MIDYDEEWIIKLIFRRNGSVAWRACLFALPSAMITVGLIYADEYFPEFRRDSGMLEISGGQVWAAATACLMLLLSFRAKQSLDRFWEGTGLLHQMRGEWFDAVSCCITFSMSAKQARPKEVTAFRHTLVRLMSLCHGSALEEIKADETDIIETIDVAGLDLQTLSWIVECKEKCNFNKVELIVHLMQILITQALEDKTLNIPPPILSRVYQTLSRGFVNLLNAKKISDTRFPFPFAQLISMLLLVQMLCTPLVMSVIFQSAAFGAATTFCFVFGAFSINFISSELENPFGDDANDLPLAHFQTEMNSSLLMLLHPKSDNVAGLSQECKTDFDQLFLAQSAARRGSACRATLVSQNSQSLRNVMSNAQRGSSNAQRSSESQASLVAISGTPSLATVLSAKKGQLMPNTKDLELREEAAAEQGSNGTSPKGHSGREGALELLEETAAEQGSNGPSTRGLLGRKGAPSADMAQAEAPLTPSNRDASERVVEEPSKELSKSEPPGSAASQDLQDRVCPESEPATAEPSASIEI